MKTDIRRFKDYLIKIGIKEAVEFVEIEKTKEKTGNKIHSRCGDKVISYLRGESKEIDCEINKFKLTDFQKDVFREVKLIKYGETLTYSDVCESLDRKCLPVTVGQALSKNPFPLIIPCHRVVKKNSLGGYGFGKEIKRYLINLERSRL